MWFLMKTSITSSPKEQIGLPSQFRQLRSRIAFVPNQVFISSTENLQRKGTKLLQTKPAKHLLVYWMLLFLLTGNTILAQPTNKNIFYQKVFKSVNAQACPRQVQRYAYCPSDQMTTLFKEVEMPAFIDQKKYKKFSKASIFPQNLFEFSEERRKLAKQVFQPLLDSLVGKQVMRDTLRAEILILGYSDLTPRMEDIIAYDYLCRLSRKSFLDQKSFQDWFSFVRARETGSVIMELFDQYKSLLLNFEFVVLDIIIEGRGIEKPESDRTYSDIDDKRRIAKVYWRVNG
jgi:hypothetical protein